MRHGSTGDLDRRLAAPRIAVLGPVAMGAPDGLRPLGGLPARALLALAAADRPCGIEALAEVLWPAGPPASYRPALHVHLGKVRRALETLGGGARLTRSGEGYSLDLGRCELDADLAVEILERARHDLFDDPAEARRLVEAALKLWRGDPYTIDGDVVVPTEAYHLEAMRRDAEDVRVEIFLLAGESHSAEEAAARGVASEPLREHRWGQLLRARYLAGRTGAAVATYQEARRALVDELGIEPGPELRDLEAAALTHDVARLRLTLRSPAEWSPPPPSCGAFVGREQELQRAARTVTETGRLLILGPPGVGKSRFAQELMERLGLMHAWVEQGVGVSPSAVIDWARRHSEALVVLDGAEEDVDSVRSVVHELARSTPRVRMLIVSRRPIPVDSAVEILRPLTVPAPDASEDEIEGMSAVVLLRAALRDLAPGVAPSSVEAAALVRHAAGLPLAIRLAAGAMRTLPAASVLALPASGIDDEIDLATRSVLGAVDAVARATFLDLAFLGSPFDLEVAAGVAGLPLERASVALVTLADHGLVQAQPEATDPFSIPAPLRAVGQRLNAEAGRDDAVADRLVELCLARARDLERLASDAVNTDLEVRVSSDLARFRQALASLAARRDPERALSLACHAEFPLYSLGWWRERAELFESALAIPGPSSAIRGRAHALRARAGPLHLIDMEEAKRSEEVAIALGRPTLRAFARVVQAQYTMHLGRYGDAAEVFDEARHEFDRAGRGFLACDASKFLGLCRLLEGDHEEGLRLQRDALSRLRRDHPSAFHVAHALGFLGHSHRLLGDDAAAFGAWTEGSVGVRRINNRGTGAHIAIGLGELAVERHAVEEALALTSEALDLLTAGNVPTYQPWAWTVALRAHLTADDLPAAAACAHRALAGLDRVPPGESVRLGIELAGLAVVSGDDVTAARILGTVAVTPDRRELPFPSPSEADRCAALRRGVETRLGVDADVHFSAGERCSLPEASGRLLAELV